MKRYVWYLMLFMSGAYAQEEYDGCPKVSIITSIYKGGNYIAGFLEDIVKQTIFDQCELILINANSPENEEEAIKPYLNRYSNIIYLRLTYDPGLYGVWNMAINMARGIYLTNANLDDRVAHNCYEIHAQALDENPEVDLVYSGTIFTKKPNITFEEAANNRRYIRCIKTMSNFSIKKLYQECSPHEHPMWRKSMHTLYGNFDEWFKASGDLEMWLRAATRGAKFKRIPHILGLFYWNEHGLSHKRRAQREIKRIRRMYKEFLKP